MKNKALIITAIIFFILVNTTHYWVGAIGEWTLPLLFALAGVYFFLWVVALWQIILIVKENFKSRIRIILIACLTIMLIFTYFNPPKFLNDNKAANEDILISSREDAASCTTTLKLKENHTFIKTSICFGMTEINGYK